MKRAFRWRWLFPVAGLLSGIVGGMLLRSRTEPAASVRSTILPPAARPQTVSRRGANPPPEAEFDRMRAAGENTLKARIKLEQMILAMPPEEARKRMWSAQGAGEDWLRDLLFFRAAEGDPHRVLTECIERKASDLNRFHGLFRAWVRIDPVVAFTNAEAAGGHYLTSCVRAWAEVDPAACARELPGKNILPVHLWHLTSAWLSRDPQSALTWVNDMADGKWTAFAAGFPNENYLRPDQSSGERAAACRDSVKNDFYRSWVRVDPLAGLAAVLKTDWGSPHSVTSPDASRPWNRPDDWFGNAFSTYSKLSPELAARAAMELPADRLNPGIVSFVASPLERAEPGAGVRFAETLPAGSLRDAALNTCVFNVAMRGDYETVRRIVEGIEGETTRGVAAASALNAWTPVDPHGARAWLEELEEKTSPEQFKFIAHSFIKEAGKCAPSLAAPWNAGLAE